MAAKLGVPVNEAVVDDILRRKKKNWSAHPKLSRQSFGSVNLNDTIG